MSIENRNIAILILAAGSSSRMGRPKQLLPWKNTNLLGNAMNQAIAAKSNAVFVVLGANSEAIRKKIIAHKVEVIDNPNWKLGLGSSIGAGISFLVEKKLEFDGILIMLADQPLIDLNHLNLMMKTFYSTNKSIIATSYGNRAGVPAIFDKAYFDDLKYLTNDYGAKQIIEYNKSEVFIIDAKSKITDIDTETEYQSLLEQLNNTHT